MSETERQFREKGWTREASDMYRWNHDKYGVMFLPPDYRDELMDAWLTGFMHGKESTQ